MPSRASTSGRKVPPPASGCSAARAGRKRSFHAPFQPQVLQGSLEWLLQQLREVEVSAPIGAERHDRTPDRTTRRNGYRERPGEARRGTGPRAIPKRRPPRMTPVSGTTPAPRAGAQRGHSGSGRLGRQHAARGRPGAAPGMTGVRKTDGGPRGSGAGRPGGGVSAAAVGNDVPVRRARCHIPQRPRRRPGREQGGGRGHGRPRRRGPRGPRTGCRVERGRGLLDDVSAEPGGCGLQGVRRGLRHAHEGLRHASQTVMQGPAGSGAGGTSCATCAARCPQRPRPWGWRWSGRSSSSPTGRRRVRTGHRSWPGCTTAIRKWKS